MPSKERTEQWQKHGITSAMISGLVQFLHRNSSGLRVPETFGQRTCCGRRECRNLLPRATPRGCFPWQSSRKWRPRRPPARLATPPRRADNAPLPPQQPLPDLASTDGQHSPVDATTASLDRKQLAQKIQQLRHEIAQFVLGGEAGLPSSPLIDAIRTQHGQLQDQIGKGQDRVQQLSAAKAQYEPLEKAYAQKQKELAGAESKLEGLAQPLGHAAFQAHRAGEVANQPCFADRIALQGKIETLHKEHAQLAPPSDASIFQKTKAKAQQLVVAGKIKMEEMKIGGHETQIGKSLLDSSTEQTIACATTAGLLEQVSQQRTAITKLRSESEAARAALDAKRQEFCGSLRLSRIENAGTFDAEIRECKSRISRARKELTTLEHGIPDRLAAEPGEMGTPLAGLLGDLRQANEQMASLGQKGSSRAAIEAAGIAAIDRTRQFAKTAVDAAKSSQSRGVLTRVGTTWRNLGQRRKIAFGTIGGGAIVVAIFAFSLLGRKEEAAKVAQRKAAFQFIAVALKDATLISHPDLLATTYAHIAEAQVQIGDAAGARHTLEKAKAAADQMGDQVNSKEADAVLVYRSIAEAQAKAGDVSGAMATAEKIGEEIEKVLTCCHIAEAQAETGDTSGARQTLERVKAATRQITTDSLERPSRLIAVAQAKAGDISAAKATVERMAVENNKIWPYQQIAKVQAEAGDLAGAKTIAEQIREKDARALAYCYIAAARQAGDVAEAKVTAESISDAYAAEVDFAKQDTYYRIAEAQAKKGDMTGAEATAEQISNGVNKVLAYREIAKAQSEGKDGAGDTRTLAKAKAVAEQIRELGQGTLTVQSYCAIAEAQAQVGDATGTCQTLEKAKVAAEKLNLARRENVGLQRHCRRPSRGRRCSRSDRPRGTCDPVTGCEV